MKHRRSWEGAASESDAVAHALVPRLSFFFFLGFATTQLDSRWTGHILAIIGPYWVVSASDRNGPKWVKQVEIGLESCRNSRNWLWMMPKHPKSVNPQFYSEYLLLLLCCFFFFFFLCFFFFFFFFFFAPVLHRSSYLLTFSICRFSDCFLLEIY